MYTHYVHSRTIPIVGLFVLPNIFILLEDFPFDVHTWAIITVDNRKYNMLSIWKSAFVLAILYFIIFPSPFFSFFSFRKIRNICIIDAKSIEHFIEVLIRTQINSFAGGVKLFHWLFFSSSFSILHNIIFGNADRHQNPQPMQRISFGARFLFSDSDFHASHVIYSMCPVSNVECWMYVV